MPVCLKCKKEWPEGQTACPDDGWSFTGEMDRTVHPPVTGAMPVQTRSAAMKTAAMVGYVAPAGVAPSARVSAAVAVQAVPSELVEGMQVNEYIIEKKIGEGGMGAVYSALHPVIGKRAAIKVISAALGSDQSAVNRFVQEARSVNQIGHPNIVDVFAFGELPDGRSYFVMEYLQGESLADRTKNKAMPLGEAIEILDQVADALEAAHEKQIVHRDLKPDNVYLASVRGGRTLVKLLDFGIAKLSAADGGLAKTSTGMMMGTPGYISPEQARGKNVDHRTDIYALGCMTFEIVCGRLPFIADNAMDIVMMHMTTLPPKPSELWPEIPPPLETIIERMLEKDVELRPTLSEIRDVFAEPVTSGLVTITNTRGSAFSSGLARMATPVRGTPVPSTMSRTAPGGAATAVSTAPGTLTDNMVPGTTVPGTTPPVAGEVISTVAPIAAKKSTKGLLIGAIAAVALLGGGGAFFAMRGGASNPAPTVAATQPPVAPVAPPVAPPPPKPVDPPKPIAPVAAAVTGGTLEIEIDDDTAHLEVDGVAAALTAGGAKVKVDTEGMHKVTITATGRKPYEGSIDISGGKTVALDITLEKLPKPGAKHHGNGGAHPGTGAGSAKPNGDYTMGLD